MQHYYIGKRRAQEIRAELLEKWENEYGNEAESDTFAAENYWMGLVEENASDEDPLDLWRFSAELQPATVERILSKLVDGINSKEEISSREEKDFCSLRGMKNVVRRQN